MSLQIRGFDTVRETLLYSAAFGATSGLYRFFFGGGTWVHSALDGVAIFALATIVLGILARFRKKMEKKNETKR